jgi:hypothetical protein
LYAQQTTQKKKLQGEDKSNSMIIVDQCTYQSIKQFKVIFPYPYYGHPKYLITKRVLEGSSNRMSWLEFSIFPANYFQQDADLKM